MLLCLRMMDELVCVSQFTAKPPFVTERKESV